MALALVTAATAAGALFLAGPLMLRQTRDYSRYYEVDADGWTPLDIVGFPEVDSIADSESRANLLLRYDADAPDSIGIAIMNVLPDGSMRCDTMDIPLRGKYGESKGRHGYGVDEIRFPFAWPVDVTECRTMEIAPVDVARGILSVGILIQHDLKNENHSSSKRKTTPI